MRKRFAAALLSLTPLGCGGSSGPTTTVHDAGHDVEAAPEASLEDTGVVVFDTGTPPMDTGSGGGCTGGDLAKRWAKMDTTAVTATSAAGLDIVGLTLPMAQAILCPGADLGTTAGGSLLVTGWGGSNEVQLTSDPASGAGQMLSLYAGYAGAITAKSDPAAGPQHTYTLGIGPFQKDGSPFTVNWAGKGDTEATELYNALLYTFGPAEGVYEGAVSDCAMTCPVEKIGTKLIWYILPLEISFTVESATVQPGASTVEEIDLTVQ